VIADYALYMHGKDEDFIYTVPSLGLMVDVGWLAAWRGCIWSSQSSGMP